MSDLFERLPDSMNKWKDIGDSSRFFGLPISEMNREELLAIIGCLVQEKDRSSKRHESERDFWYLLSRRAA